MELIVSSVTAILSIAIVILVAFIVYGIIGAIATPFFGFVAGFLVILWYVVHVYRNLMKKVK